jgi:hypothetical protein
MRKCDWLQKNLIEFRHLDWTAENRSSNPSKGKLCFLSTPSRPVLGSTRPPNQRELFPGGKGTGGMKLTTHL